MMVQVLAEFSLDGTTVGVSPPGQSAINLTDRVGFSGQFVHSGDSPEMTNFISEEKQVGILAQVQNTLGSIDNDIMTVFTTTRGWVGNSGNITDRLFTASFPASLLWSPVDDDTLYQDGDLYFSSEGTGNTLRWSFDTSEEQGYIRRKKNKQGKKNKKCKKDKKSKKCKSLLPLNCPDISGSWIAGSPDLAGGVIIREGNITEVLSVPLLGEIEITTFDATTCTYLGYDYGSLALFQHHEPHFDPPAVYVRFYVHQCFVHTIPWAV